MAGIAVLATVFTALLAAPLVFGSHLVARHGGELGLKIWLGAMTALFGGALAAGAVALVGLLL